MVTRTATLRLQLLDAVSGPSKPATAALRNLESTISKLGSKGMPGAKNLVSQLEYLRQKSAAVGRFSDLRRGLADTFGEFRTARARVKELEAALNSATKPTAKMRAELRSAQSALKQATTAYQQQRAAVDSAASALRTFNLSTRDTASAQRNARDAMAQTIRQMRDLDRKARESAQVQKEAARARQQAQRDRRRALIEAQEAEDRADERRVAVGLAGAAVARGGYRLGRSSLLAGIEFDKAYKGRDAIGDYGADGPSKGADSERLNKQAERLGKETEFSNADIVYGQTAVLNKGIRSADEVLTVTEEVVNYARVFGIALDQAAASVVGMALGQGIDYKDPATLKAFIDRQAWVSKNSGMQDEDLRQFAKYGGPSARIGGLSDEYRLAMGMVLNRQNVRGDEAGVAVRAFMTKLLAPTNDGRMALQSMGLRWEDYVTSPGAYSGRGLRAAVQERFGVGLTNDSVSRMEAAWDGTFVDEAGETQSVKADKGEFIEATMSAIASDLGEMKPKDKEAVAKAIGKFWTMSIESVDVNRLVDDLMKANPELQKDNALFTSRQGGRAALLFSQREQFYKDVEAVRNTPEGVAKQIGEEKMSGIYGDWERMLGAFETALTRIGQDFEAMSRPLITGIDSVVSAFIELPDATRRVVEGLGVLAVALGGFAALRAGQTLLGNFLGKGKRSRQELLLEALAEDAGIDIGEDGKKKKGKGKSRRGLSLGDVPLIPWAGAAATAVGAGAFAPATPNNQYTSSSPEERARARDDATRAAADWNALPAEERSRRSEVQRALDGARLKNAPGGSWIRRMLFGNEDPAKIEAELASQTAGWSAAAQQGIQGYIQAITAGGDNAEAKAEEIGRQIADHLTVNGKLTVDTSDLERAIGLARQYAESVRSLPGVPGRAPSAVPSAPSATPSPTSSVNLDGRRAHGGTVKKGGAYLVGERGPELVIPERDGFVLPNSRTPAALGGSASRPVDMVPSPVPAPAAPVAPLASPSFTVNVSAPITVNARGGDGQEIAQQVERAIQQALNRAFGALDRQLQRSQQTTHANLFHGDF